MAQDVAESVRKNRAKKTEFGSVAEQNLTELQKDYEHFAYIVSHDLQEPIRSVASFTQLLQEKYSEELSDNAQQYLYFAAAGARQLQDMVSGLLEYSRVSTRGEVFTEIDLDATLSSIVQRLSLEYDCSSIHYSNSELPIIMGDNAQLQRVLYNLLYNALSFNQNISGLHIEVKAVAQERGWCFEVSDNGNPIPPRMTKTIFAPFQHYHAGSDVRSAGMGLAIARRIVQRHGGDIWLQQYQDDRKTFYFVIPYIPQPTAEFSAPVDAASDNK